MGRVCTVLAVVLLCVALDLPFVSLHTLGRVARSTLLSGPRELGAHGLPSLGFAVIVTLVVFPGIKLLADGAALFGVWCDRVPRRLAWIFGWRVRLSPWAMVEVFILGALVAYSRLRALAHVEVGGALFALGGVMLCMVATDATLDREAVFQSIDDKRHPKMSASVPPAPPVAGTGAADAAVVGCQVCGRVSHAAHGARCPRCGHRIRHRQLRDLSMVWALLVSAALLYLPANILPVMTIERMGKGGPTTIGHGVRELADAHLWPLAILVLFASILVPMGKIVAMVTMLVMTHRRSPLWLKARTRAFRVVHGVGRWSMIDIFMLATLVGVVRLGFLATVLPGAGAIAFCAVVAITMVATELFDPRLMWDAAGLAGISGESGASHG